MGTNFLDSNERVNFSGWKKVDTKSDKYLYTQLILRAALEFVRKRTKRNGARVISD